MRCTSLFLGEWIYNTDTKSHFKVFTSSKNWSNSRSHCLSLNADLASITSNRTNEFLINLTKNDFWSGGYLSDGSWRWSNSRSFFYKNWHSNEPNNYGGVGEDRIQVYIKSNGVGTWNDLRGTAKLNYVCEKIQLGINFVNLFLFNN